MITEDAIHGMYRSLKTIVGETRIKNVSDSDLSKLVEFCNLNEVNPETLQGGLFAFYLVCLDKELSHCRSAIQPIAKQLANATLGMSVGLNIQIGKVIEDVICDTVEWNKLDPTDAALILGNAETVELLSTILKSAIRAVRVAEGKEE